MALPHPRSTRTDPPVPYTTRFRSGVAAGIASGRGDVHESHAALPAGVACGGVVCVEFARDLRAVAAFARGERRHAPVRDRQHQHAVGAAARMADRTLEQGGELVAILVDAAAAVLVVDTDEQAGEVTRDRQDTSMNSSH